MHPANGQGMTEFALALPIILLLAMGIIEFGHMIFFYSTIYAASKEAARYGSAEGDPPQYLDCSGIRAAAKRIGGFSGITQDSQIQIGYDSGGVSPAINWGCPPTSYTFTKGDRIHVIVTGQWTPFVPLVKIQGFPITSETIRTIIADINVTDTTAATEIPSINSPILTSISPSEAFAGSNDFTLTATGSNFASSVKIVWNGDIFLNTVVVNSTTLTAVVSSSYYDINECAPFPCTRNVYLVNPGPIGGYSDPLPFTIKAPILALYTITPSSIVAGSPAQILTLGGTAFSSSAVALWNGANLDSTTFVDSTHLTAVIPASKLLTPGTFSITVNIPGIGTTSALQFSVTYPPPSITSLSPTSGMAYNSNTVLTVNGTDFFSGISTVQWNGTSLTTTYVSPTQLTATIPLSTSIPGLYAVTVLNSSGGPSNEVDFQVTNPVPVLSTVVNAADNQTAVIFGGPGFTLKATGSKFISGSIVRWGGTDLATTFGDSTTLTANVPASLYASAGTVAITVFNPTPGGGTSASVNFTVSNMSITSLNPASKMAGDATFLLTVNGTSFVSGAKINWNGTALTTNFVNATQLTTSIPASSIATYGSINITVTSGGLTTPATVFTINNPVPVISGSGLNPATAYAGGNDFTLTITGTNFVASSIVQWDGTALTTTYVSATQVKATVTQDKIASANASILVTVTNPAPGGGTSPAATFTVTNALPSISSLSPSSHLANNTAFTLTVNGTGFSSSSVIFWGAVALTTTFDNVADTLSANISSDKVALAGSVNVSVVNPSPGGGTSNSVVFSINNPSPAIISLSPSSTTTGSTTDVPISVFGTGFVAGSVVHWSSIHDNINLTNIQFISGGQLNATITKSLLTYGDAASITVINSSPGGGTSTASTFMINNPIPTLSSLSPSSTTAGGSTFTLTVNGTNFVPNATVRWNGADLVTTWVSTIQLTATVLNTSVASSSTASITVYNPAPVGGTSSAVNFLVNSPAPSITTLSPSSATAGGSAFTLTVNGSNFIKNSIIQWNGSSLTTTWVSSSQLTAPITATMINASQTATITIYNPAPPPGGLTSNSASFPVNSLVPAITTLSPSSANAGGSAFTLTVNGSNFIQNSIIKWNGTALTTTWVSASQLTAPITAAMISISQTITINVFNPAPPPGGLTSGSATFTVNALAPTLTSLSPASIPAGSTNKTLTANGTNFVSNSVIKWNGVALSTSFVSSTQLQAVIPDANIAVSGSATITVMTPAPGGGTTSPLSLLITCNVTLSNSNKAGRFYTISVNNSQGITISLASFTITWTNSATLTDIYFTLGSDLWSGNSALSASGTLASIPDNYVNSGGSRTLTFYFSSFSYSVSSISVNVPVCSSPITYP